MIHQNLISSKRMLYWLILRIHYLEHTKHQDTYGMNYGLRQRNAGYWQLSKRVHNTKELELSGKGQINPHGIFLRYEYRYELPLKCFIPTSTKLL